MNILIVKHPIRPYYQENNTDANDDQNQSSTIKQTKAQLTQQHIAELETLLINLSRLYLNHHIDHATKKEAINNQQQQLAPLQQQSKILHADIQSNLSSLFNTENSYSESTVAIIDPLAQINNDTDIHIDHRLILIRHHQIRTD